jgi:hypothetical protein
MTGILNDKFSYLLVACWLPCKENLTHEKVSKLSRACWQRSSLNNSSLCECQFNFTSKWQEHRRIKFHVHWYLTSSIVIIIWSIKKFQNLVWCGAIEVSLMTKVQVNTTLMLPIDDMIFVLWKCFIRWRLWL